MLMELEMKWDIKNQVKYNYVFTFGNSQLESCMWADILSHVVSAAALSNYLLQ